MASLQEGKKRNSERNPYVKEFISKVRVTPIALNWLPKLPPPVCPSLLPGLSFFFDRERRRLRLRRHVSPQDEFHAPRLLALEKKTAQYTWRRRADRESFYGVSGRPAFPFTAWRGGHCIVHRLSTRPPRKKEEDRRQL